MSDVEVKTFVEALPHYHSDPKQVKKCLSRRDLSDPEKKIIECWSLMKEHQFLKVLSILDGLSNSYHALLDAQKYLLLGIALNHKHGYQQAIPLLLKSYEVIREYSLPKQHVMAIENLFVAYQHVHDKTGMRYCLKQLAEHSLEIPHSAGRKKAA